jgi:hypothetical protein
LGLRASVSFDRGVRIKSHNSSQFVVPESWIVIVPKSLSHRVDLPNVIVVVDHLAKPWHLQLNLPAPISNLAIMVTGLELPP